MSDLEIEPLEDASASDVSLEADWKPRSKKGPIAFGVLVLAGLAFGLWTLLFTVTIEPTRILIAVESETIDGTRGSWWGANGKISARYADAMSARLKKLGLEPLVGGEPEFLSAMEKTQSLSDVLALARSEGVGWVLTGTVKTAKVIPIKGSQRNLSDYIVRADLQLHRIDETDAQDATSIPLMAPEFFLTWQPDVVKALEKHNMELMVNRHVADVSRHLAQTERLSSYASTEQETTEATVIASKLAPLFAMARRYELAIDERDSLLAKLAQEATHTRAAPSARTISPLHASEQFIGNGVENDITILRERHEIFFDADKGQLTSKPLFDELLVSSDDGQRRKSIFQTYNIFSFPQVSDDGRWIAAVVDHHNRGTSLVRVSTETGENEEFLFTENGYMSDPSPSPDGKHIVYWAAECPKCDKAVHVASFGKKTPMVLIPSADTRTMRYLPRWGADGSQLFLTDEREGFMRSLWSISFPSRALEPLLGNALDTPPLKPEIEDTTKTQLDKPDPDEGPHVVDSAPPEYFLQDVSADGKKLLLAERRDSGETKSLHLVEYQTETKKRVEFTELQPEDRQIRYAPDGQSVAFRTRKNVHRADNASNRADWEIGTFGLASGKTNTLTVNTSDEYFLDFSRDGKRLYYRTWQRKRTLACRPGCNWIHWIAN
jgi:Tol biopolymer transport system component